MLYHEIFGSVPLSLFDPVWGRIMSPWQSPQTLAVGSGALSQVVFSRLGGTSHQLRLSHKQICFHETHSHGTCYHISQALLHIHNLIYDSSIFCCKNVFHFLWKRKFVMFLKLRNHLSWVTIFAWPAGWSLYTGFTVLQNGCHQSP